MSTQVIAIPRVAPFAPLAERSGLWNRTFVGLLVTQFLGAFNDNMFRWLVVPIGKSYYPENEALPLAAGLACFVLPYVLLAAPAGFLADRFGKHRVIVGCKAAELVIMLLGIAAIYTGSIWSMFGVLMLMGSQSALFGPSKFGCLPEVVPQEKLSVANGLIGLTTVVAIVFGSIAGNYLYHWTGPFGQDSLWISALALCGVAGVGLATSLAMRPLAAADPHRRFPVNPVRQTVRDLSLLVRSLPLLRVAAGIAFFWSLASLAQLNVDLYGRHELGLEQFQIGPLLGLLVLGMGVGNVLAGLWSRGKVELGLVPLGAAGIAVSAGFLFTTTDSYAATAVWLFAMGASAGLFDVPLQAYLQQFSPRESRGAILAASNFLTFLGTLLSAGLFYLLRGPGELSAAKIFLISGICTLPVAFYALRLLPQATIRFVVWLLTRTIYRVRVAGAEHLPSAGGAVLVANHVSWVDGLLLVLSSPRPVRMVAYAGYVEHWWVRPLARLFGVIPIQPGSGRQSVMTSLEAAREAVLGGDVVCIFPEGGITRTGQLQPFKPGVLAILKETGAPLIPVYLDGLWGSIFSHRDGKFFWKRPRQWPYPVSINFGAALLQPRDANEIRRAVQDLGVDAVEKRKHRDMVLPRAFLRNCRRNLSQPKLADSTGMELTGAGLMMRSIIFRRLLAREVLADDEKFVGLLLPPSGGGVLANVALPLDRRVPVNLNYSCSSEVIDSCIQQCGIRHVLTSKRVMQRLKIELNAELVYLEDLIPKVTKLDKLIAAAATYAMPLAMVEKWLGVDKIQPDDLLTVLFTSGSTGEPKGVMLSHKNVASNVQSIDEVVHLTKNDCAMGILPFFHSYGYTATMWTMLALAPKAVYHFSPLEAQQIGELTRKHRANIMMSTPTFLRSFLKRCKPEDFASLDVVFASAERLPPELSDAFEKKFGIRPSEAYGATELAPLACVNVPDTRSHGVEQHGSKEGSVGRPIPGVTAKIVHPESGETLGVDEPGMLWFKGPNVMLGYLNHPEETAKVVKDGWYMTGDIAKIDAGGFVTITGRESRFSKIGGEMVPHIKVEDSLARIIGTNEDMKAAVTAVPDQRKGERLVVLHTALEQTPSELCAKLAQAGLPKLWIPAPDSFCEVEELPILGSGKLDLKTLKNLAMDKFGFAASSM